ncbi:MAG: hypothetical protein KGZ71_07335 [Desulfobulbaceae bacterium]|nr:hypothetical protein [Desulfobulbaceae bacterium]
MNDAIQISKKFFHRLLAFSVILSMLSILSVDLWHSHDHDRDENCAHSTCCDSHTNSPDETGSTLSQGKWTDCQSNDCSLCLAVKFQFAKYFQSNDSPKNLIEENFTFSSEITNPTIKQNRVNSGRAPPLA